MRADEFVLTLVALHSMIDCDVVGAFAFAPDLEVRRVGFGGAWLTGPGTYGPPKDSPSTLLVIVIVVVGALFRMPGSVSPITLLSPAIAGPALLVIG